MVANTGSVSFEDALSSTGFGKFNFLMLLVVISIISGMVFETLSVSYLVPVSACELNTTVSQQGLMAAIPVLGIIATSHFWGYLADTKGRRKILEVCLILSFVFGAAAALSPNWIMFCILKFLSSSAVSGTYALALTLLSEVTPQHKRAFMVSLITTVYMASSGLMAVLSIPVLHLQFSYYLPLLDIQFTPWRLLCIVLAAPCGLATVCVYFSFESPRYLLSVGEEKKALKVLEGIYRINTGKTADDYNVKSLILGEDTGTGSKSLWSSIASQTLPLLKPPLLKNTILMSVMFVMVYFAFLSFVTWLPDIADGLIKSVVRGEENLSFCGMLRASHNETAMEDKGCNLNSYAMVAVFVVCTLIAALGSILSSVINLVGRKRTFICVQLIAGAAGLCVNFPSSWLVSSILVVIFISGVANFGFLTTFTVDLFPTYVKAMAVCLTLMVGRSSSVLGINVLKNLLVYNCELSFYIFGGIAFVGGFMAFLLPGDSNIPKKDPVEM